MAHTPSTENGQHAQGQDASVEGQLHAPSALYVLFARHSADVHARLQSDPPPSVANIGCGGGRSSISLARAYPKVRVDGYDMDEASIELAWANARAAGLTDRVTFHVKDVGDGLFNGRYDLVVALAGIHHMAHPVGVLQAMRRLAGQEGAGHHGRVIVIAEQAWAGTLERYAKEAGFNGVESLPLDNTSFLVYRLETAG